MEYANGGDLYSLIKHYKRNKKTFSEDDLWRMTYEIMSGLEYLHSNNIIHRDIKCLNLFLTKDKVVKIGDLGVSKIVSNINALHCTRVGTPLYLSPELIKQVPYDFKVDMWSTGCSLYHLACLEPPFQGDNLISLGNCIVKNKHKPLSTLYSSSLNELIDKLLSKKPEGRPSAKEALVNIPQQIKNEYNNKEVKRETKKDQEVPDQLRIRPMSSVGIVKSKTQLISQEFKPIPNPEISSKDVVVNEFLKRNKPKLAKAPTVNNNESNKFINVINVSLTNANSINPPVKPAEIETKATSSKVLNLTKNNQNHVENVENFMIKTEENKQEPVTKQNQSNKQFIQIEDLDIPVPNTQQESANQKDVNKMKRQMSSKQRLLSAVKSPKFRPLTANTNRGITPQRPINVIPKLTSNRPFTAQNIEREDKNNIINININFYNIDMNKKFLDPLGRNASFNTKDDSSFLSDQRKRNNFRVQSNYIQSQMAKGNEFIFDKLIKTLQNESNCRKLTINDL